MSTDGDLWSRALARGLAADQALLIVRPGVLSLIVAGRRLFQGACATWPPWPPSGLYAAAPSSRGAFLLTGVDRVGDEVLVSLGKGERLDRSLLAGRELWAIVEASDPAAHGHA